MEEDYFDHLPIKAAIWPAELNLTEFIILTKEDVQRFQFKEFEVSRKLSFVMNELFSCSQPRYISSFLNRCWLIFAPCWGTQGSLGFQVRDSGL